MPVSVEGAAHSPSRLEFVDHRAGSALQRRVAEMANNSTQAMQLKAHAAMASNSARTVSQRQKLDAAAGRRLTPNAVGNDSAPLQLRTLNNASVNQWVSWSLKGGALANLKAIMLSIYNQMKIDAELGGADFTGLPAARLALIGAGHIDQEDIDNLEAEATRRQQAGADPAALVRMRIEAKIAESFDAVDARYGRHIFTGDVNAHNVPTGFHSKADGSATHTAYGTASDVGNVGAYQQSVRLIGPPLGAKKPIQSTFFPDAATHQQVIRAIASVYEAGLSTVAHVDPIVNGMRLTTRGNTVFPAGGSDDLVAEQ